MPILSKNRSIFWTIFNFLFPKNRPAVIITDTFLIFPNTNAESFVPSIVVESGVHLTISQGCNIILMSEDETKKDFLKRTTKSLGNYVEYIESKGYRFKE